MRARLAMQFETAWANQLNMEVVAELDNPHTLATREVSSIMLSTLRIMAEEARAENERAILHHGESPLGDAEENEERERGVLHRSTSGSS